MSNGRSRDIPLASRRIAVVALAVIALAILGLLAEYVPSAWMAGPGGVFAAFALGISATIALIRHAAAHGRIDAMRRQGGVAGLWPMLLMPFLLAYIAWCAGVRGLPWVMTRALGNVDEWRVTMMMEHPRRARLPCVDRLHYGPLDYGYVCAPATMHAVPSGQNVHVVLVGRRSVLGFAVTQVLPADAAEPIAR